jgi:hypothetical protein
MLSAEDVKRIIRIPTRAEPGIALRVIGDGDCASDQEAQADTGI